MSNAHKYVRGAKPFDGTPEEYMQLLTIENKVRIDILGFGKNHPAHQVDGGFLAVLDGPAVFIPHSAVRNIRKG